MKTNLKILANGQTGTGKTFFAMTCPKYAYVGIEPGGFDTALSNPQLMENCVMHEEFMPSPVENMKQVFERMDKFIKTAYERAMKGEVETLIVDNLSYLSENRWMYINQFEPQKTQTGALDIRSMYGELGRWMYKFTLTSLLSFPGNSIATSHEMKEDEEEMTRKVDPTVPIMPNILGGFRGKVAGMFSAAIYLDKSKVRLPDDAKAKAEMLVKYPGGYKYSARCQKGGQRDAKNRYNLPEIIENVSYQAIVEAIAAGGTAKKTV